MKPKIDYDKYTKDTDYSELIQNNRLTVSPRELVCVYCVGVCHNDRNKAYSCEDVTCPLWPIRKITMTKQHILTQEQIERFRKQIVINRNKRQ